MGWRRTSATPTAATAQRRTFGAATTSTSRRLSATTDWASPASPASTPPPKLAQVHIFIHFYDGAAGRWRWPPNQCLMKCFVLSCMLFICLFIFLFFFLLCLIKELDFNRIGMSLGSMGSMGSMGMSPMGMSMAGSMVSGYPSPNPSPAACYGNAGNAAAAAGGYAAAAAAAAASAPYYSNVGVGMDYHHSSHSMASHTMASYGQVRLSL